MLAEAEKGSTVRHDREDVGGGRKRHTASGVLKEVEGAITKDVQERGVVRQRWGRNLKILKMLRGLPDGGTCGQC